MTDCVWNLLKKSFVAFSVLFVTLNLASCGSRIPTMNIEVAPLPPGSVALNDGPYTESPWPGAHRDTRNSDYVPYPSPDSIVPSWYALEGENFFMGPTVDASGNVYVTSAGGPSRSHLHSFDRFGNLRWASKPMENLDDLDYAAFVSAPVLGDDDDLYLADANQLRRYRASDGEKLWTINLPEIGVNRIGFSAFILTSDLVGYAFGDGNVGVFNRHNGSLAYPLLQLPGVKGPPSAIPPPGLFTGLVYEPFIRET